MNSKQAKTKQSKYLLKNNKPETDRVAIKYV